MKCERYDHKPIEKKWQDAWEKAGVFHAENHSEKPKYYALIEFPYPSGPGPARRTPPPLYRFGYRSAQAAHAGI